MTRRLRIVSVNDVYLLDNLPRFRGLVDHYRTSDPADATLVVLAGDFLAPSILSSIDAGRGMVECLNAVGVDYVILGNHEDDLPTAELHLRLRELNAICLGTNVLSGLDLPKRASVEVGEGLRVGLVGVVMADPTMYRGKPFGADLAPANEAAWAEARRLLAEGCAAVIPITHQSLDDDRHLARSQQPPFPAIIGGHEHLPILEQVDGATWIVKAGAEAVHAVVTDITWTDRGALAQVTTVLDDVARYPESAEIRAKVDKLLVPVRELSAATMLHLAPGTSLSSIGARAKQTSFGTLLCSRLRDALAADACVFNGGGIRASKTYLERLTYGDIEAEVPFDNEVVVATIPGAVIREAIAYSRRQAPFEAGAFLQVDDGVIVGPGNLVVSIQGEPLDPARGYRVALVRELLAGLDRIEPLVRWAKENPLAVPPLGCGREPKMILVQAFAVAIWRELGGFDAIDVNRDEKVTASEVAAAVSRAYPSQQPSTILADIVVRALDLDADQIISRADEAVHVKKR